MLGKATNSSHEKVLTATDEHTSITVPDEVFEQLTEVMREYECENITDATVTASAIALGRDEAALARLLAQRLAE